MAVAPALGFALQRFHVVQKRAKAGMTEEGVPSEIHDFLNSCIDSVAALEALLLLREAPEQDWAVTGLARRLYIGETEAAKILEHLVQCELAQKTGTGFRYHARDAERQALVDGLAKTHAKYLVQLTRLIHDKASGIRKFADAFKFRKDS
jgi:predicted transcriptional regulator